VARIAGVDLPTRKNILIALTYIYGIGLTTAKKILADTGISPTKKVKDLTDEEITKLRDEIARNYKVEGELKAEIRENIRRLIEIKCYRGIRHIKHLPVRGQRTHTNARTHKGPRPQIGAKKKKKEQART